VRWDTHDGFSTHRGATLAKVARIGHKCDLLEHRSVICPQPASGQTDVGQRANLGGARARSKGLWCHPSNRT